MFELLAALLLSQPTLLTEDPEAKHARAERKTPSIHLTPTRTQPRFDNEHPWPVKVLSIGHTNASYQNYSFDPYFHHGLDIRADAGSTVIASAGGKVVNIENYEPGSPAYWEIAILDDLGFLWQYHHVDRDSIPQKVVDAFENGGRIEQGEKIGEVYYWPIVSFGERYHHIHLNILGSQKQYFSPFLFLEPLEDKDAPKVVRMGILKDRKEVSESRVSGQYSLYAEVHDLIQSNVFINPPHELTVSVDGAAPRTIWNFTTLPGGADISGHVEDFYVSSMVCGNYSCRKPVIDLGFSLNGNVRFPEGKGSHSAEITAKDFYGNEAKATYSWQVD